MRKMIITFSMGLFFGVVFLSICGQGLRHTAMQHGSDYSLQPISAVAVKNSAPEYEDFKQKMLVVLRDNERMLIRLHAEIHCGSKQIKATHLSLLIKLRLR